LGKKDGPIIGARFFPKGSNPMIYINKSSMLTVFDSMDYGILAKNITAKIICHPEIQPTAWQFPWTDVERKAYEDGKMALKDTIVGAIRLHEELIRTVLNEKRPFSSEESATIVTSLATLKVLLDRKCPTSLEEKPYYNMEKVRKNIKSIIDKHHDRITHYLTGGKRAGASVGRGDKTLFIADYNMSVEHVMLVIIRGGRGDWVDEINENKRQNEEKREEKERRGREGR
jgi:hypothetical protein